MISCGERARRGRAARLVVGLTDAQVEPWQRFPYLVKGYRSGGDHVDCVLSWAQLHNETANIWIMLLSVGVGLAVFTKSVAGVPLGLAFTPFAAAFIGQMAHAPASIGYHTFMCMSKQTASSWRKADLCLIFLMNVCATYALGYFIWGFRGALLSAACVAVPAAYACRHILRMQPGEPLDRKRVVGMLALTNLGYYVPVLYRGALAVLAGRAWPEFAAAALMVVCHGASGLAYATHWPQCRYPGRFDYLGYSHNILLSMCCLSWNLIYPYLANLHASS